MSDASASTATGTTATASRPGGYRGRFAPSPTGPLHLGSLYAAVGSYLDARHNDGIWLLRMEDVDAPREVPGAAADILATLAAFGLVSDEPVLFQSHRLSAYDAALDRLAASGALYSCSCSRREATDGCAGGCRDRPAVPAPCSLRLRMSAEPVHWSELLQALPADGRPIDPVLRRRDGLHAYQLAVVVDDAAQGITHVVRGADLLDSTGWQVAIQRALGLDTPTYAHLAVLTEPDGSKLAKSKRSVPVSSIDASAAILTCLQLLGQSPPASLTTSSPLQLLSWGIENWDITRLKGLPILRLQEPQPR